MKIVADSVIPFIRGVFEPYAEVTYKPGAEIVRGDVAEADAVVVRTRTQCNESLLAGSSVKLVATATIGTDHIDLDYCRTHGIEVASAAGCNARGVLQWVAAVLSLMVREPRGVTLGVVGVGHVGSLVRQYASAWGFEVLCSDPPRERCEGLGPGEGFVTLEEIAARCDAVTFHVPMNRGGEFGTYHLAGEEFFASLKPGAMVLNSSRGAVVDTVALRRALKAGRCRAALDVWEHEPQIDPEVLSLADVATCHIAGYSLQGKAAAAAMAVEAVARRFGLPLEGWYPEGVRRSEPRPIGWCEMCRDMTRYADLVAETALLKSMPERFEELRDNYRYREEFF